MANILLTRVDYRLIHGQVAVGWVNYLRANMIVVVNDEVANDTFQQSLMDMAVSSGIETRYFSIEEAILKLPQASAQQKLLVVVRYIQDALKLIEGGLEIKEINIGNLHYEDGKKQIAKSVAINEADRACIRKIAEMGVKQTIQRVPEERGYDIVGLL
ncbi:MULTISPECIES: PTS sugar transporter subunit IIB [Virgibacillus]|uniref:PTS system, N-acetylgalactosamine-specific IIB component n=1 Tax=Virgibacillus chiguensis TaxID=411959 RepID=A0A1M5QPR2_9BACI|nr:MULTISPECIES: PTS sugar transporter subunit IIB [Virgibacillus]SHH15809.1 PTS system, N-acetylgalactosamine-specific IIB component [Virgibacillus chiguensis]